MKDDVLQIRCSTEDKQKIKDMAKENKLTLTDFIIKKCNEKCNDVQEDSKSYESEFIHELLVKQLQEKESILENLRVNIENLSNENLSLRKQVQEPQVIEVNAFNKSSVNGRPNINIFVDWMGYSMFVRNADNLEKDKERKEIYHEVWDKHIYPMYKEFCEKNR